MTRFANALCAFLIALPAGATTMPLAAAAADEAWRVGPAPSDNPDLQAASVTNADGHTVYLWALAGDTARQVFCELHLADGQRFGTAMPAYRIDDRATIDTADIRDAGDAQNALWGHVGERAAFWLIANLTGETPAADAALAPWLGGRELVVSYGTADGVTRTARFTLVGSDKAIRSATGMAPR